MSDLPLLSIVIFFPALGSLAISLLPSARQELIKWTALFSVSIPLIGTVGILSGFDPAATGFQFTEKALWIPAFEIQYFVGIDGISVALVALTSLISFIAVMASWGIEKSVKGYFSLYLLLHVGMMGVFCALDLFLFFVFWEVMLLPMYFLIGVWGGERKEYAAIKFFLYTMFGSIFLLFFVFVVYSQAQTFSIPELLSQAGSDGILPGLPPGFRILLFVGLFIAFAVKVPIFPFHTWLPDAHVEAPTPISVILAGILLKLGLYGMFRMNLGFFPDLVRQFATIMAVLGTINIVYGGFCALAQADFKKLVAYSSISHMGYALLGLASGTEVGLVGAIFVMVAHGMISPMMFLCVGVVYDRAHHREIERFGGLANKMPIYFGFSGFTFFAALGLPGLAGFVGEVMSLIGAYQTFPVLTLISLLGILIGAAYCLWTIQRVFLGPENPQYEDISEIHWREIGTLAPLGLFTLILGVYPAPLINLMRPAVQHLQQMIGM